MDRMIATIREMNVLNFMVKCTMGACNRAAVTNRTQNLVLATMCRFDSCSGHFDFQQLVGAHVSGLFFLGENVPTMSQQAIDKELVLSYEITSNCRQFC